MENRIAGRAAEQRLLSALLQSDRPEFLAVYGRRRVGKTFLVREYFERRAIVFQVTGRYEGRLKDHLRIFAEAVTRTFAGGAELAIPESWHDAFQALRKIIEARPRDKKKLVLFFDELPWMATRRSGCLEELEFFWNDWCSRRTDIVLVVCGSAASFILDHFVNAKGGFHNRLTRHMPIAPFTLSEVKEYLKARRLTLTDRQLAELYLVLGGVPYYLSLLERGESPAQAVDRLCLGSRAPLLNELDNLFTSLFGPDDTYSRVVRVLAKRRQGLSRTALLEQAGLTSGGGAKHVLTALCESGFVLESVPFGRSSRDRFYRLVDEFVLFALYWLERGRIRGDGAWTKVRGKPSYHAWAGLAFESLCLKHVGAIKRALGISGIETLESSWLLPGTAKQEGAQIDLVVDRADGVISICEMKYCDEPFLIDKSYAKTLKDKLTRFREHTKTKKALHLVLVTMTGLRENQYSDELVDRVVTLADLFV